MLLREVGKPQRDKEEQEEEDKPEKTPQGPVSVPPIHPYRSYTLRAVIPWDKLSDFVRGVVMPLRQDRAELKVEVSLEAQSESRIKPTTLKTVKETLSQIGAEVVEERIKDNPR